MRRVRRILRIVGLGVLFFLAAVFLINTTLFSPKLSGKPLLIAHRGLGQTFHREGLTGTTCTASRIFSPEHAFLEDTIPSFKVAFEAGADIIEFDVQPTTDGAFVVFHDWTLDCRTDGRGVTREHALAELRGLDLGYGYTADGGRTFPFRGKGAGLLATLDEVLDAFPGKRFMVNIKSADPAEGKALAAYLAPRPSADRARLIVYGDGAPVAAFHATLTDVPVLAGDSVKQCFLRYLALGWTGYVPAACRQAIAMVPVDYAPWLWGYPQKWLARIRGAGALPVLLGPYDGSGYSSGIDDAADFARIPQGFDGAIWTNRIDRIGPLVSGRPSAPPPGG